MRDGVLVPQITLEYKIEKYLKLEFNRNLNTSDLVLEYDGTGSLVDSNNVPIPPFKAIRDGNTEIYEVKPFEDTVPESPILNNISETHNSIFISWDEPYDGGLAISKYTVELSADNQVTSYDVSETKKVIDSLSPNTDYTITVFAHNELGKSPSQSQVITTGSVPVALTTVITPESLQPRKSNPIEMSVTFNDRVVDFAQNDISLSIGTITNFRTIDDNKTFFFDWNIPETYRGMINATIAENSTQTQNGLSNDESEYVMNQYVHNIVPHITSLIGADLDRFRVVWEHSPLKGEPESYTIMINEYPSGSSNSFEVSGSKTSQSIVLYNTHREYTISIWANHEDGSVNKSIWERLTLAPRLVQ